VPPEQPASQPQPLGAAGPFQQTPLCSAAVGSVGAAQLEPGTVVEVVESFHCAPAAAAAQPGQASSIVNLQAR
jgi:hypothetical protein